MEFAFTEDQLAFRDAVRDLLAGTCPPEAVRAAWDADDPWDRGPLGRAGEMGVVGLMAAEAAGGLGLTEVDLVLLLEEAGRAALPEPLVEPALLASASSRAAMAKVAVASGRSPSAWPEPTPPMSSGRSALDVYRRRRPGVEPPSAAVDRAADASRRPLRVDGRRRGRRRLAALDRRPLRPDGVRHRGHARRAWPVA